MRGPYWRQQRDNSPPRAYGDFRHLGGKREPLCAPGERLATTDPVVAAQVYAARLAALTDGSQAIPAPAKRSGAIGAAMAEHVQQLRTVSGATAAWLDQTEQFLGRAVKYFGATRQLRTIDADDVVGWLVALRREKNGRGGVYREETVRKHLHALGTLFRRAQRAKWVPPGHNPVALLERHEKPGRDPSPDVWLEVPDAARLLDAARSYRAGKVEPTMRIIYPLLATFLLTGGRADEVLGLDLRDIDFDRKLVHFRPNAWRRGKKGKTAGAERSVPLWPQLEEILRAYLEGAHLEVRLQHGVELTLLFPSPATGGRITDIRKLVDQVARRCGLEEGKYRATAFRKTYASARLQTLDRGAPVAQRTVQDELGHRSADMIQQVYGRLGKFRHRSEVIEYRTGDVVQEIVQRPGVLTTSDERHEGD